MMSCLACERIEQIQTGRNPHVVVELRKSFAVLADDQRYEGYCILLLKTHVEHLGDLPTQRQLALFEDVIEVAEAITQVFQPVRLNYECLGNTLGHVHWHVIPRYEWDPEPNRPIWVRSKEERRTGVDPGRLKDIITRLRKKMRR